MFRTLRLIHTAPLLVRIHSRECYTYLYRIMQFIGWIPPEQGIERYVYLLWMYLVYALSGFYLPIGLCFTIVIDFERMTPGEFLDVTQICVNIVGASVKSFMSLNLVTCLRKTELYLNKLDRRLKNDRERLKIHKAVARCNYILVVYVVFYWVYTLTVLVAGIFTSHPPWMVYNPLFDWRDGTFLLWAQTVLEYTILMMMACKILVFDIFPIIYVIICRSHVDVLKYHISSLRSDPLKNESEHYDELVSCISDYTSILNCSNLMRSVISRIIFVQFLLIGIVLGLALINVIYFSSLSRAISSIVFVAAVLSQTFPLCYLCDLLIDDCKDLPILLCHSNWIDAEYKFKSTLRIFMTHLQKPISFTAGDIFPISIGSNIKVAKFAFSVMTILQRINLADKLK